MTKKPFIISVASFSGGGKTTVVNLLLKQLRNAKALYFDDYDFEESPDDICEWVEGGADYNQWQLTPFIKSMENLIHTDSPDYLLLDYPFAYLQRDVSAYIDLAIFIDTPLDIAMARRILRDFTDKSMADVRKDLSHYLVRARTAYLEMDRSVKPSSDHVIDGSFEGEVIVDVILEEMKNKK
ncbi:hypothetical protein ACM26V_19245 [Salipaludibacillus sp. HK11]|uniref:hypothetical protein n=1 Tax=Salipaludibacillus sp. HK11 TaxID=3394320 RepID=UPI0039FCF584